MTRLAGLATLFLALSVNVAAVPIGHAEDNAMRAAIESVAGDTFGLEARLAQRFPSLPPSHIRLIAEHTEALLREDDFAELVIGVAGPLFGAAPDTIFDRGAEVGLDMQVRGLARLPTDRQEEFLRYSADMFRWLSDADVEACKAMTASPTMPPAAEMQRLEYAYLATVPPEKMSAVMQLYRDAILAELRKVPSPVALTAGQRDAAMFAYSNRIMTRLASRLDGNRLIAAASDLAGASAADVCNFTVLSMDSVFDLTGDERIWLLQAFVETMDEPL